MNVHLAPPVGMVVVLVPTLLGPTHAIVTWGTSSIMPVVQLASMSTSVNPTPVDRMPVRALTLLDRMIAHVSWGMSSLVQVVPTLTSAVPPHPRVGPAVALAPTLLVPTCVLVTRATLAIAPVLLASMSTSAYSPVPVDRMP